AKPPAYAHRGMIRKERCIIIDLDGTLCAIKGPDDKYEDLPPIAPVLARLREYKEKDFYIIIQTARNMRTHEGNMGRINAMTTRTVLDWLEKHGVPFDELHVGKPWQGAGGFYVDDKAIRPDEFAKLSYEEILKIVGENPAG